MGLRAPLESQDEIIPNSPAFSCPRDNVPCLSSDKGHVHRLGKQAVSKECVLYFPGQPWEEMVKHHYGIRSFWFKLLYLDTI